MSLFARNKHEPFVKSLGTGNKKWIFYENPGRKPSWSQGNQPPLPLPLPLLLPLALPTPTRKMGRGCSKRGGLCFFIKLRDM